MEFTGRCELAEVGDVGSDQHAIFREGEFEHLGVGDAEPPALA